MALPRENRLTEAEYLALEGASDTRHEFVDGQVFAMSGASERHLDISVSLSALLYNALQKHPCKVYQGDLRVLVSASRSYFYPDLTIVCGERIFAEGTLAATLLNPQIIIEILSPSTELYDRTAKFTHYQQIKTLQDYVLVSQQAPRIECFSRGAGGTWILTQADGLSAMLKLPSIDITLALKDIYEQISFE